MINPLFYIFGLMIGFLYPLGIEPLKWIPERGVIGFGAFALSVPTIVAVLTLLYALLCVAILGAAKQFRRMTAVRLALRFSILVIYVAEIYLFHFPLYVQELCGADNTGFLSSLLLYLPFLMLTGVHGLAGIFLDPVSKPFPVDRMGTLLFQLRGFFGFALVPTVILLLVNGLFLGEGPFAESIILYPFVGWMASLVLIVLLIGLAPVMLKWTLGAGPLPKGPLRTRLESFCARTGMSYADLLLWKTHGSRVGNAFITGLVGPMRYIFLTDYLVEQLSPEEIEAVMGHEIGHVKGRHMVLMLLFSLAYVVVVTLLSEVVWSSFHSPVLVAVQLVGVVFLFWAVLFGFVSRRFETQADLLGMEYCGDGELLVRALGRVADINGMPRDMPSHRHFSIGRRMRFIESVMKDPGAGAPVHHYVASSVRAMVLVLGLGGAACMWFVVEQIKTVPERRELLSFSQTAERAEGERQWQKAEEAYLKLLNKGFDDAEIYIHLGDICLAQGQRMKAYQNYRLAQQAGPVHPQQRRYVIDRLKTLAPT